VSSNDALIVKPSCYRVGQAALNLVQSLGFVTLPGSVARSNVRGLLNSNRSIRQQSLSDNSLTKRRFNPGKTQRDHFQFLSGVVNLLTGQASLSIYALGHLELLRDEEQCFCLCTSEGA
jgi:hypothetical protein